MARTEQEIYQQLADQKALMSELNELDNESNTAIYNLWLTLTASIMFFFEKLMDDFKAAIQGIIDGNQYGTVVWWKKQLKGYQHGDLLVFMDNIFKYASVDTDKQIIKYFSLTDNGGKVQIKVAKQSGNEPAVLTIDELNGVVDYVTELRPSGVQVTVQSLAADLLKLRLNVYYNANGDINIIRAAVELAITNFLANMPELDGVIYIHRLIDAIQVVPGIVKEQVEVLESAVKGSGDPYVPFISKYSAKSGYFKIDPDFPLAAQINYLT